MPRYQVLKDVNPALSLQNLMACCDIEHKVQNKDSVGWGSQRWDSVWRLLGALGGTYSGWK